MKPAKVGWFGGAVASALLAGCAPPPGASGGGAGPADGIVSTSCNSDLSRCVSFFPDGRVELKWCDGASTCSVRIIRASDPVRARSPDGMVLRQEVMVAPTANTQVSACDKTFSRCAYIHPDKRVEFRLCDAAKQCATRIVERIDD